MPIELKERHSVRFFIDGEDVEVYFRKPNASEMVKYLSSTLSGKGAEGMSQMLSAGIELALCCILGVREGDIVLRQGEDSRVLITDPERSGFDENWKALLKEKLPGLLLMLGNHLVRSSRAELEVREKN